jgi:hypothetical protein
MALKKVALKEAALREAGTQESCGAASSATQCTGARHVIHHIETSCREIPVIIQSYDVALHYTTDPGERRGRGRRRER